MKHVSFFICLFFWVCAAIAQTPDTPLDKKKIENTKPPISLYKVISHQRDTTYVDTTLSIQKSYKFNYLRSDTFELLPFSNVGQTYNALAINTQSKRLIPLFAAQSHHYNYKEIEDVSYFNVPTPLTEIYFKTAFEQGQQLQAFFTINTSKQFNFSMSYQGVRSLGTYQQSLTSTGNLLITSNYFSKNDRYNVRFHVASHDILNRENGGLTQNSLDLFINDDPEFNDRGRLDVNFEDAENNLKGVRLFLNQEYALTQKADSIHTTSLTLGNSIWYEDKLFEYRQQNAYEQYGASYEATDLYTKTTLEEFNLQGYVKFTNRLLGNFKVFTTLTDYNYGYNTVLDLNSGQIPNRIKDKLVSLGGTYQKQYKGFDITAQAAINISGTTTGNYINATAGFNLNEDTRAQGSIKIHNAAPNFNFQLYQSDYVNYNWKTQFNTIKTQELGFDLWSKKIANLSFTYTGIDDYTYFAINGSQTDADAFLRPTPMQFSERVNYLKLKAQREFNWRGFALNNTIMYQNVLDGAAVFNVPELITRQSLYYKDTLFKKALFFQTGVNLKYFTAFNSNGYDPVLAEFYVQNEQEIGGFPMVDLFFNAKIRQTRIFVTWEHFNALFSSTKQYFSAPGYPYRDSLIRFGLVWNFFL